MLLSVLKATNLVNRRLALLVGPLIGVVFVLLPTSSRAQCSTIWDAGGAWQINQHGQKFPLIKLQIQQNGGQTLTGTANQTIIVKQSSGGSFGEHGDITGKVTGTIIGDGFSVNIAWSNGTTGVYKAIILPSGNLEGKAWEIKSPNVLHTWHSMQRLRCMPPPDPKVAKTSEEPPKPKPLRATGRKINRDVPPMKVPGILAGQVIYPFLGALQGTVILTWDAGPDNPYAEVWYKVNGGDAIRLIEKGKGAIQVPVERARTYTYILTDAGKTLATVSFAAQ